MSYMPITGQLLMEAGYEKRIFFFQIGGGEDEDDIYIYVKDGIAVTYESTRNQWYAKGEAAINYVNGFNTDTATKIDSMEELNALVGLLR